MRELLELLREALAALVPVAEKARIPWREGEAYDDWDGIAASLYQNIVVRTIASAVGREGQEFLPKYDLVCPSYGGSFIEVVLPGPSRDDQAVFVGFIGTSSDFPTVGFVRVGQPWRVPSGPIEQTPFDLVDFRVVLDGGPGESTVQALTVPL